MSLILVCRLLSVIVRRFVEVVSVTWASIGKLPSTVEPLAVVKVMEVAEAEIANPSTRAEKAMTPGNFTDFMRHSH